MGQRIFKNRFYVLESIPSLCGFKQWDRREYRIVTGHKAARERPSVIGEFKPAAGAVYRLENGRLRDFQPRVDWAGAVAWLTENPSQCAVLLAADGTDSMPEAEAAGLVV